MKWRVVVELTGMDGTVQLHEVGTGSDTTAVCSVGTLGLTLADAKRTLGGCSGISFRRRRTSIAVDGDAANTVGPNVR